MNLRLDQSFDTPEMTQLQTYMYGGKKARLNRRSQPPEWRLTSSSFDFAWHKTKIKLSISRMKAMNGYEFLPATC
eukprot:scaffold573387_cov51-Prasinocladus_malaysianus.AAC.2